MNEKLTMPVRAQPYKHQQEAFALVCRLFGVLPKGGDDTPSIISRGAALLMEM